MARGAICGAICGLVGAVAWAGIAYGTGYEIGWIAWGVGFLVGLGFAWGSRGSGVQAGVIAAAITIVSILVGKYATVELVIRGEIGSEEEIIQQVKADMQRDDFMIAYIADGIAYDMTSRGETIDWPAGVDPNDAIGEETYPAEIWAQARSEWEKMSPQNQSAYRGQVLEDAKQNIQAFLDEASSEGFAHSFTAMDFLFFGLAIVTAFQIASKGMGCEVRPEPVAAPVEDDIADTGGEKEPVKDGE